MTCDPVTAAPDRDRQAEIAGGDDGGDHVVVRPARTMTAGRRWTVALKVAARR